MNLSKVTIENFRNIDTLCFEPNENVNIIYGDNAQGKTNLMEAIWIFTGGRSFRGSKDSEMIKFGCDFSKIDIEFFSQQRNQQAQIVINKKRNASLNKIPLSSSAKLAGKFCAVVFSPIHLSLIKDGPQLRRKFIDGAICQISPQYAKLITQYNRAVLQRNALLKDVKFHNELEPMLDIWEEKIALIGAKITTQRVGYINKLEPIVKQVYSGLSKNTEEINIEYVPSCKFLNDTPTDYFQTMVFALKSSRKKDIFSATTSVGVHRDDVEIKINQISARKFGSQGQQRSCVLALKLAEVTLLKEMTDENPIILLDDVMSELDPNRQDYILNHIKNWQVFITCCEPTSIMDVCNKKPFLMSHGELK